MPRRLSQIFALVAVPLAVIVGCTNEPFDPADLPNRAPVARVFVGDGEIQPTSYNNARFFWSGTDIDGFVRGFHVSISETDPPEDWTFTTSDETTQTYSTDDMGEAFPTLYVVAEDDRAALSDTVSVTFPLVNFPPILEFEADFQPLLSSFGAATFEFQAFDLDGNETLLPHVDYRFEGSDPDLVFEPEDINADPAVGWVRENRNPTRFNLLLRDIPGGDEAQNSEQTIYVRVQDEALGAAVLEHTWQNFEAVGEVLLIDDDVTSESHDAFYRDALQELLPDAHSIWDIALGLPTRDSDLRLTLEQFQTLVWYTGNSESPNLLRTQAILTEYLTTDLDPIADGVQPGRLLLETYSLVLPFSGLTPSFRGNVLGVQNNPNPRNQMVPFTGTVLAALGGALDIAPLGAGLPTLTAVGENYLGGPGLYFGLFGLQPVSGAASLWEFENYTWGGPGDPTCRLGCTPVVAIRNPATGPASTVTLGFQLEYADGSDNAKSALHSLLTDHLGVVAPKRGSAR